MSPSAFSVHFVVMAAVGLALAACGDDGTTSAGDADAGATADAALDASALVTPPAAPARVTLTPCPAGWIETPPATPDGVATCDPFPMGELACDADVASALFPGEPGCASIGTACPAGDFAAGLPADAPILYVRAGATGGDGSQTLPFGTIEAAMTAAAAGTVIAVGKGRYDEVVRVKGGVTLWGACPAETIVAATADTFGLAGTISPAGAETVVRNLQIGGDRAGVHAAFGRIHLEDVVIAGARDMGILATASGAVTARSIAIRGTRANAAGEYGFGVAAATGGDVVVSRAVIERNTHAGAVAFDAGSRTEIEDATIRDTVMGPMGFANGAISASDAEVVLRRVVVLRPRETGIAAQGASVAATDLVVRESRPGARGLGDGVRSFQGSTIVLERALIDDNRLAGVASAFESALELTDVLVRGTGSNVADRQGGRGIAAQEGTVRGTRVRLEDNEEAGLWTAQSDAQLDDLEIAGTRVRAYDGEGGRGVNVERTSTVTIRRALVDANHEIGVFVHAASALTLEDAVVRGTLSNDRGIGGMGVSVQDGSTADLSRIAIESNLGVGLFSWSGTVTGTDVAIASTGEWPCYAAGTCTAGWGYGVSAVESASVMLSRFVVTDSALCGVQVASNASLDLAEGLVARSPIGANVQVPGYDLARISTTVRYVDNDTPIDTSALPLPEPSATF